MRRDEELKARFDAMKREEARVTPSFAPLPVRRRRVASPGLVAALALLVVAAAWLLLRAPAGPADDAFAQLDRTAWVGPTDFLLDLGDRTLLSTVPEIGAYRVPDIEASTAPPPREAADERRRRS